MTSLAKQLASLKLALQDLESAVQRPRDEQFGIEAVVDHFPAVLSQMYEIIRNVLEMQGMRVGSPEEAFVEAHKRGWVKGEIALWLRLLSDFQQIQDSQVEAARAKAVAQDIRACSCMLWETFELLTARFRYQTQVQPAQRLNLTPTGNRFVAARPM